MRLEQTRSLLHQPRRRSHSTIRLGSTSASASAPKRRPPGGELAAAKPRRQQCRPARRTTGSPRVSGNHAAQGRGIRRAIGLTKALADRRPVAIVPAWPTSVALRGNEWRGSGDAAPVWRDRFHSPASAEDVICLPRLRSRPCACCRPDPRQCASAPGSRSRRRAATVVDADLAPGPDDFHN